MFPNRVTHIELVELDMVDFDVIWVMVWLHDCLDCNDCRTRIFKFNCPNEPILELKEGILFLEVVSSLVLRLVK